MKWHRCPLNRIRLPRRARRSKGALLVMTILGALVFLIAGQATAHEVHVFATTDGEVVNGRVYYAGDKPAAGLEVIVLTGEGMPVGITETDSEGRFRYDAEGQESLRFVVEIDGGHRAEFTIAFADDVFEETEELSLTHAPLEIRQLSERIDSLEHRLRFQDIIGGIGYIVGVMGLFAFWKARSGQGPS